jgi:hypothetical protein
LQSQGFIFPVGLQALLLEIYCHHNKVEEAISAYSGLMSVIDQPIDDLKILKYANLLATNERYDGKWAEDH